MNSLAAGAVAGLTATVPMTAFMRSAHNLLPRHERYSLPPEAIAHRLSRLVGSTANPHEPGWAAKTYVAHFGFGGAAGAAYGATSTHLPGPAAMKGSLFGVGVWAASYLGWLPAAGLFPPATEEPARRNLVMLAAHVIWGATVGVLADRLAPRPNPRSRTGPGDAGLRGVQSAGRPPIAPAAHAAAGHRRQSPHGRSAVTLAALRAARSLNRSGSGPAAR